MKTNFRTLNRAVALIIANSSITSFRNDAEGESGEGEGEGGVAVADAKVLQEEYDKVEAEMQELEDEIDARDELQTEEETEKLQKFENQLSKINQKIVRAVSRAARKNARPSKVNMLGRTGTAFGGKKKEKSEEGEGSPKHVNVKEAWLKDPLLGYKAFTEYMNDVKQLYEDGDLSKQVQHITQKQGGIHAKHGVAIPLSFTNSKESKERNFMNANGVHMPTDPGMQPVMPSPAEMSLQMMPGGEENQMYSALTPSSVPMQRPELRFPFLRDKDHRYGLFGGIVVTDRPETECLERLSKMEFGKMQMKVGGTYTLAAFHEMLLRDSPVSLVSMFQQGSQRAFRWAHIEYMLYGSSTGHFEGILKDTDNPALIRIGRRSPGTTSLHYDDLLSMRQHCYGYGGASWFCSTTMLNEIEKLNLALVNGGRSHILFNYNAVTNTAVLMGRPLIVSDEFCDTDALHLLNSGHYYYGQYQSPEFGTNPYLLWLCDKELFKITKREVGKNAWECPLIPRRSQIPKSPFITLSDDTVIPECPEMDTKAYRITQSGINFESSPGKQIAGAAVLSASAAKTAVDPVLQAEQKLSAAEQAVVAADQAVEAADNEELKKSAEEAKKEAVAMKAEAVKEVAAAKKAAAAAAKKKASSKK